MVLSPFHQITLPRPVTLEGVGIHTGEPVRLTLRPAAVGAGVRFLRTDVADLDPAIPARAEAVCATRLGTVIGNADGVTVSTVEHLMAALCGLGVDNVIVEIDGPEVPIMDGSAQAFVEAIDQAGIVAQQASRRCIKVLKPVRVGKNGSFGELLPYARGLRIETEIEFDHPIIGRQTYALNVEPAVFRRELARARTFGFMRDVAKLWSAGYALGASFENTVVIAENRVLNAEGVRFPDEFVRHKAVDAIGDMALAGAPLIGCYRSVRGGHKLNHAVLCALMADRSAWTYVEMPEMVRRTRGHAEVTGLAAPNYGPEVS